MALITNFCVTQSHATFRTRFSLRVVEEQSKKKSTVEYYYSSFNLWSYFFDIYEIFSMFLKLFVMRKKRYETQAKTIKSV